jgi:hypothetical protein
MRKFVLPIVAMLVGVFAITMNVTPASAQATRTWVSGVGDDVNPCSRTAPCKTFAGAISKTQASGEINCLDSGGFGTLTITKSISVICNGVVGGVLANGTPGFTVNVLSTDRVLLQGLDIEGGSPTVPGTHGVRMVGAGRLTIDKTYISGFAQYGVDLEGTASARVFITNSFINNNTLGGFLVQGISGATNNGLIDRTTIDSNGAASVKLGPGANFTVSGSVLTGSGLAIDATAGGTVTSYGNSVIRPPATINTPSTLQ